MEKVITNVDILCHLIKYLNLKEQLNLTRVSKQFCHIIVIYKWKNQYKELRVIKTPLNYILTNLINEKATDLELVQEYRTLFDEEEFKEFLEKNSENIQKLYIENQNRFEETSYKAHVEHKCINLVDITYYRIKVTEEDLKVLSMHCPKLEKLCLADCLYRNNLPLIVGRDIDGITLESLKMLKSLELDCPSNNAKYEYRHIEKILDKLELQQFILNGLIQHYDTDSNVKECDEALSSEKLHHPCKELTLGGFESQVDFDKLNTNILNNFINLTNLSISGYRCIVLNNTFFTALSERCDKLKYLQLHLFKIENFAPLQSLDELIIKDCSGLTWKDLKKILSDMKLKSFTSILTKYSNKFKFFKVSPSLEYFNYIGTNEEFQKLFEMDKINFQNLTTLMWNLHHYKTEIFLNNLSTYCPKLQTLVFRYNKTLIMDIPNLKNLRKLSLFAFDELLWSAKYLLTILKHSSLSHLTLFSTGNGGDSYFEYNLNQADLNTNVLFFTIPMHIFKMQQVFYLELLTRNAKLNLIITADKKRVLIDRIFLQDLIKNPKFPQRLKSIKIYGFNIDCQDLRDHFDVTFNWIETTTRNLHSFQIHLIL